MDALDYVYQSESVTLEAGVVRARWPITNTRDRTIEKGRSLVSKESHRLQVQHLSLFLLA